MAATLITGCGSGIGQATALHLARTGRLVIATMRNPETGAELLREAAERESLRLHVMPLDVASTGSVTDAFRCLIESHIAVGTVINAAGIPIEGPVEESTDDDFRLAFETDCLGAIRVARAALPNMRAAGRGHIINVSAAGAGMTFPRQAAYAAAKHALEAVSEVLAAEVAEFGVRVSLIEPGYVATPFFSKTPPPSDPYSPYAAQATRHLRTRLRLRQQAQSPEAVAAAIEKVINDPRPRLRYIVGDDAEMLLAGRQRLSDDEWVAANGPLSQAQEEDFWNERFGFEL